MPIGGTSVKIQNNLFKNIKIEGAENIINNGQLQWTLSLENYPSGSITFENLLEKDVLELKKAYIPLQKEIKVEGIPFNVSQFQYSRTGYSLRSERFSTYNVTISLSWLYQIEVTKTLNTRKVFGKKRTITPQDFAKLIDVPYEGPSFDIPLVDETITFEESLKNQSKILGCILTFDHAVRLTSWERSPIYRFAEIQVLQDGGNTIGDLPVYNDVELIWNDTLDLTGEEGEKLVKNGPEVETLIKQDKNPDVPPPESISLRSLDSNFNHSGPSKTKTVSKVVDGNVEEEETFIYGFEYTSQDILSGGEVLEGNPSAFWKIMEQSKTYKVHKPLDKSIIITNTKIPVTEGKSILFIPNPNITIPLEVEYTKDNDYIYLKVKVTPETKYLTKEVTEGKKRFQFLQETEQLEVASLYETKNTYELDAQLYDLYLFKDLPTIEEKAYLLTSTRALNKLYPDPDKKKKQKKDPFDILDFKKAQYEEAKENADTVLPYKIETYPSIKEAPKEIQDVAKNRTEFNKNSDSYDPLTAIAVVTADPSYVEPYSVVTESSRKSAFAYTKHPEPDNELQPYVMTGEESYHTVERKMMKFGRYQQITSEFSSQNSGFTDGYNKIFEEDILGELPSASTITPKWETEEPLKDTDKNKRKKYLLTSDFVTSNDPVGGSINLAFAKTKEEAIETAKLLLRMAGLSTCTVQRTYAWYYPDIRPGDKIVTGEDLFQDYGDWCVTNISFSLVYKGENDSSTLKAFPIILTEGTSMTLGLDKPREVTVTEKEDASSGNESEEPISNIEGDFPNIGEVILHRPNRRKF
jgi:hypothetical protein